MKRFLYVLMLLIGQSQYIYAQAPNWECDTRSYAYDMTVYVQLSSNGVIIENPEDYQLAAFCGDECRGVATVLEGSYPLCYALRIRSNATSGETIMFRCYGNIYGVEYPIKQTIPFVADQLYNYPSSAMVMDLGPLTCTVATSTVTGGTVSGAETYPTYTQATLTATPSEGYSFGGWSDGTRANPYTFTVLENVQIDAMFTPNKYLLSYTVDGEVVQADSVDFGTTIIALTEPTREGHTFHGWYDEPSTMPAHDVTVTGYFTVNKYLLTYKVDGVVVQSDSIAYGTKIIPLQEPTKEGYTFSGWSDIPETMPAHDVTVEGYFPEPNTYILTYKVDGEVYKTSSVAYGASITPEAEPTREGYTFSGWSEIPATMPADNVTVEGHFIINSYELTYKVDDVVVETSSVEFNSSITSRTKPTKEGHTFHGWYDEPTTMPAHDVTVTGYFTVNKYLLTYKVDGVVVQSDSIVYSTAITPLDEPTKEGYIFSGWSEIPETMPANDVIITGSFSINSYLLSYIIDGDIVQSDSIVYGSEIIPLDEPTKEGHTFSGWSEIPETMPAYDVTITGTFTPFAEIADETGLRFVLINNNGYAYSLAGCDGNTVVDVEVPEEVNGYPVTAIGDAAFKNCSNLKSVVVPENITSAGTDLFLGTTNLLVVEWNSPARLSADCFDNPSENGNLLVYVKGDAEVRYRGNIIKNGEIDELTIIDGRPMRVTKEFHVEKISYTKEFVKKTFIGESAGWEGVMLPFDVQRITHETKGEAKVFWLAEGRQRTTDNGQQTTEPSADNGQRTTDNGLQMEFVKATEMKANVPYIISMPNNERYLDEYNLNGKVTFSSENVLVRVTTDNGQQTISSTKDQVQSTNKENGQQRTEGVGAMLVGTTEGIRVTTDNGQPITEQSIYVINDELYSADGKEFMPGGVFVQGLRDVRPFEAYVIDNGQQTTDNGAKPRYIPIRPSDGKESDDTNLIVAPHFGEDGTGFVYDLSGRIVANDYDDFCRRKSELKTGVYIYKNQKVMIRR